MGLRQRREQETGKNCIVRSFMVLPSNRYCYGDKIMESKVGRTYSMRTGDTGGRCMGIFFGWGALPEGNKPVGRHSHIWEDNINIHLQTMI